MVALLSHNFKPMRPYTHWTDRQDTRAMGWTI